MGGGGGMGGGMGDIFEMFMGGGGGRGGRPRERKSEDVLHKLTVSLEDLYNGTTK
jgi:DnaJ-class molecular chaperone